MTGPYASFKGKLKVGDRVRVMEPNGSVYVGPVHSVSDLILRVSIENDAKLVIPWEKNGGTIELLAPSPVETGEEWWKDRIYYEVFAGSGGLKVERVKVAEIVAEAERRGAEKALRNAGNAEK